jgi:hypothetical protein
MRHTIKMRLVKLNRSLLKTESTCNIVHTTAAVTTTSRCDDTAITMDDKHANKHAMIKYGVRRRPHNYY